MVRDAVSIKSNRHHQHKSYVLSSGFLSCCCALETVHVLRLPKNGCMALRGLTKPPQATPVCFAPLHTPEVENDMPVQPSTSQLDQYHRDLLRMCRLSSHQTHCNRRVVSYDLMYTNLMGEGGEWAKMSNFAIMNSQLVNLSR
jgi:hypothetical protein